MKIIQRISGDLQTKKSYADYLINTFNRHKNSFTDVWFSTAYGFPTLETHSHLAEKISKNAELLRDNGIGVSMQLSNSIGHGQYIASRDCNALHNELKNARRMVGHNGTVADYCFCFYDNDFRSYIDKQIRLYISAVRPEEFWIDDDLRARNHAPVDFGCFCDDCIKRFNNENNTSFDREELVHEFLHGDIKVRESFINFIRKGIWELTKIICTAVKESCPDTKVGLQNGPNGPYTGYGHDYIFDAIYSVTGKAPMYRAGAGSYDDHNPNSIVDKVYTLAYMNSAAPDYVTCFCPEIENLPDSSMGKTMYGTALESTMNLANGSTYLSYAMLGSHPEQDDFYDRGFRIFSEHYPYWKTLSEVSEKTFAGGIRYCYNKKQHLRNLDDNDTMYSFNDEPYYHALPFLRMGFPVSYDEECSDVFLLHYKIAETMSKDDLTKLLSKNVITDAQAVEYMQSVGIDLRFDFLSATSLEAAVLGERFTDHPVNSVYRDKYFASFFSPGDVNYRFITKYPADAEVLGIYESSSPCPAKTDSADTPLGVSNVIIRTANGGKWAVMGYALWKRNIPSFARERLMNIVDYLSGNNMPAIIKSNVQAILMPRVSKDNGKTVAVSITNCTVEEQENVSVLIRNPESDNFRLMSYLNGNGPIEYKKNGNEYLVTVPKIAPWSVVTINTK
ncbi:MAG: hypothetical protein IJB86_04060 [Clostridia bacterium]|nr:hypothetical protein [Clostridia bacterium]